MKDRCYLVYALAPAGTTAGDANDRLNEYIDDPTRGLVVWHDHFVGEHGGAAVLHVRDEAELAQLREAGPLEGWKLDVHPLTFSLTAAGFVAQAELTLEEYGKTTLAQERAAEKADRRYWWRHERAR